MLPLNQRGSAGGHRTKEAVLLDCPPYSSPAESLHSASPRSPRVKTSCPQSRQLSLLAQTDSILSSARTLLHYPKPNIAPRRPANTLRQLAKAAQINGQQEARSGPVSTQGFGALSHLSDKYQGRERSLCRMRKITGRAIRHKDPTDNPHLLSLPDEIGQPQVKEGGRERWWWDSGSRPGCSTGELSGDPAVSMVMDSLPLCPQDRDQPLSRGTAYILRFIAATCPKPIGWASHHLPHTQVASRQPPLQ